MNGDLNSGDYVDANRERGVWPDNTTQATRYEGFAQGIVALAEDGYFEGRDTVRMLDVGASTGEAPNGLATAIEHYTGLDVETVGYDISGEALAANRDPDTGDHAYLDHPVQGDARQLPFQEDAFDIVTSKTLLSRLKHAEDQTAALREIDRVLTDDGVAAVEIDPSGQERIYTGDEHVVPASEFADARDRTDDFGTYPFDL